MKKFLSMMLVAAMLLSCMATVAFAAEPGETVTITFSASGNPGFATYAATINYDHSVLELKSIEKGALSSAGVFVANEAIDFVTYAGMFDVEGDGVLFTATFVIKAGAPAGTYPVTASLDTSSTANAAAELVRFGIVGGSVTVDAHVCEHEWDNGVETTPATCEAEGVKTFTCAKCGETKTEAIPALGHAWGEWTVTTPATCTEDGVETRVCANDAAHVETRAIAATGHEWDEGVVTTPATCEEDGVMTFTCAKCGETKTEAIPATGHNHDGEDQYVYDEEGHWLVCECGEHLSDKEAHEFENNGYCKCGYKKPVIDEPDDPGLDDEPATGDITSVIVLGMCAMFGMAGTGVVAMKRKNAK